MTAFEFLNSHLKISHWYDNYTNQMVCYSDEVEQAMIEYARLHVKEALLQASEKCKMISVSGDNYFGNDEDDYLIDIIDKNSILNAYPLKNIK